MFVPGIITGVMCASFLWLIALGVLLLRFNDALWRERMRALVRDRALLVSLEDHRERRRASGCVDTIDELERAM
jgi:hypothetical protein